MNYLNSALPGSRKHIGLKKFHQKSGVYILQVGPVFYVGSSKDLRSRLRYWSQFFPGAGFKAKLCVDYRAQEQRVFDAMKTQQLLLANKNNPVRLIRELKPRTKKTKAPGPGRIPSRTITLNGVTRSLTDWCQRAGIEKSLFYARLRVGWTEQAAVQPKTIASTART